MEVRRGLNQAGVAVGEKPVVLGNGVRIGGFDAIETGEGCDEHHKRRARQVEIGQQQVDGAEAIAGQDEQARLAREFLHLPRLDRGAFEEAQTRRADRDDAAAPSARRIDPLRHRGSHNAPFGVHPMLARVIRLDRQKGAGSDMQGHGQPIDPARGNPIEQRRGEMQPGRRRRDRALLFREHRLIVGAVARVAVRELSARAFDIGRQRHRAVPSERLAKGRPLAVEAQRDLALGALLGHLGREVRSEIDMVARAQPPGALGIAAPHTTAEVPRQRDLDRRLPAPADETGRDHLGVVEHQEIARPQQFGQIGDMPVGQLAGGRDHQQPGAVARLGRAVGDQVARQVETEIGKLHRRLTRAKARGLSDRSYGRGRGSCYASPQ